jgi:hypothetical protein
MAGLVNPDSSTRGERACATIGVPKNVGRRRGSTTTRVIAVATCDHGAHSASVDAMRLDDRRSRFAFMRH